MIVILYFIEQNLYCHCIESNTTEFKTAPRDAFTHTRTHAHAHTHTRTRTHTHARTHTSSQAQIKVIGITQMLM